MKLLESRTSKKSNRHYRIHPFIGFFHIQVWITPAVVLSLCCTSYHYLSNRTLYSFLNTRMRPLATTPRAKTGPTAPVVSINTGTDASPATTAIPLARTTPNAADVTTLFTISSCFSLIKPRNPSGIFSKENGLPTFQLSAAMHPHWYSAPLR